MGLPNDLRGKLLSDREDARGNIAVAIDVFNLMDEIDAGSEFVLENNLGPKIKQAMLRSLLVIFSELPTIMDKDDMNTTRLDEEK